MIAIGISAVAFLLLIAANWMGFQSDRGHGWDDLARGRLALAGVSVIGFSVCIGFIAWGIAR